MAAQMEDFDPQRIEKIRTADEEKSAYVEGKKQRQGVKTWECESSFCFGFFEKY